MENSIKIGKKIYIRNAGKNEYWLQDVIYENPSVLGLGDLIALTKEKRQSCGGRLDILLKDNSDNSMYEVEVMLGETDPSHIIRAIEYWDNEKRKYPQRQHFCVLVAESFDRRYFNVIQLMSLNIPMIAIQADLLEIGNERILNFTKIIDIYTEPEEDESEQKQVNETSWNKDAPWTNEIAKALFDLVQEDQNRSVIRYTQSYISININSRNLYIIAKRSNPSSALIFKVTDEEKAEMIKILLKENSIDYTFNRYKEFVITIDINWIKLRTNVIKEIHSIILNSNN